MSSNAVLEQFFVELPRLLEQAQRQAFSNDLNILEHFSMKIQDALNVLNVIVSRCEELNAEFGLTQEIRSLIGSILPLNARHQDAIATDEDYVMNLNGQVATGALEESNNELGRPRMQLERTKWKGFLTFTVLGRMWHHSWVCLQRQYNAVALNWV